MKIVGFPAGPYQTNCYVVLNEQTKQAFVVDPGLGAFSKVNELLALHGMHLAAVLLTHGHVDHTRDAARFGVATYIHPADEFMLSGQQGLSPETLLLFDAQSMQPVEHLHHVHDGELLEVAGQQLEVLHAPGHSPGSVLYVWDGIVFAGDVLFRGSIGRTDLPCSDADAMRESLRNVVLGLDDALSVLPGHGPTTTMGHERGANPYLRDL